MSGMLGWWSTPVAAITTSTSSRWPASVVSRQRPLRVLQPLDRVAEPDVPLDVPVAGDLLEVRLDLGAGRVAVAPLGIEREGVAVEVRGDVAGDAGVGVLPPGAAQPVGLLVDGEVVDARPRAA